MTNGNKNISKNMTLKMLEAQLRGLAHFEPASTLKEKLLTAIDNHEPSQANRLRWWQGAVGLGAVAAVVLIMVLAVMEAAPLD